MEEPAFVAVGLVPDVEEAGSVKVVEEEEEGEEVEVGAGRRLVVLMTIWPLASMNFPSFFWQQESDLKPQQKEPSSQRVRMVPRYH